MFRIVGSPLFARESLPYGLAEHTAKIYVEVFGDPVTIVDVDSNKPVALVRKRPTNYYITFSGEEPGIEVIKRPAD